MSHRGAFQPLLFCDSMKSLKHLPGRGQNPHCLSGAAVHTRGRWRKRRPRTGIAHTNASRPLGQGWEAEAYTGSPLREDARRQAEIPREVSVCCAGTAPRPAARAAAPRERGSPLQESYPASKGHQRKGVKVFSYPRQLRDFKDTGIFIKWLIFNTGFRHTAALFFSSAISASLDFGG